VIVTDGLGTHAIALTGSGIAPHAVLTPASLTFVPQAVGTTSPVQTATLSNNGNAPLSITSIVLGGINTTNFAQTSDCGATLAAGASCTISVTLTPKAPVPLSAKILVTDSVGTHAVLLTGSGIGPNAVLTPTSLTFAAEFVGTTSPVQTATLSNNGNAPLTIATIAMGGINTTNFAQTNDCPTTLAPGASCTIAVSMKPKAAVPLSAKVVITDNAGAQNLSVLGSGR
jgi:hypothetical protein